MIARVDSRIHQQGGTVGLPTVLERYLNQTAMQAHKGKQTDDENFVGCRPVCLPVGRGPNQIKRNRGYHEKHEIHESKGYLKCRRNTQSHRQKWVTPNVIRGERSEQDVAEKTVRRETKTSQGSLEIPYRKRRAVCHCSARPTVQIVSTFPTSTLPSRIQFVIARVDSRIHRQGGTVGSPTVIERYLNHAKQTHKGKQTVDMNSVGCRPACLPVGRGPNQIKRNRGYHEKHEIHESKGYLKCRRNTQSHRQKWVGPNAIRAERSEQEVAGKTVRRVTKTSQGSQEIPYRKRRAVCHCSARPTVQIVSTFPTLILPSRIQFVITRVDPRIHRQGGTVGSPTVIERNLN
ncbi:hypothetical protein Pan110_59780 [Gimesia panareensis]|nr:hypothetical protein Pan110_59780 [Gimesia panareensis]